MLSVWKFELMHTFDHELMPHACMQSKEESATSAILMFACIWKPAIGLDGSLLACMHGRMAVKCKEQLVFRRTEEIGTLL